jgi:hypothetical protein
MWASFVELTPNFVGDGRGGGERVLFEAKHVEDLVLLAE